MRYYSKDGRQFPSVTTILDATMSGDRQLRLMNALTHGNGLKRREEGRRRGNSLDLACKAYLLEEPMLALEQQHFAFFRKLQPVLDDLRSHFDRFECDRVVYNERDGYAGTIDILAYRGNAAIVIDLKTKYQAPSQSILADHWLQVIAYGNALVSEGVDVFGVGLIISTTKSCELLTESDEVTIDRYLKQWGDRLNAFNYSSQALTEIDPSEHLAMEVLI